MYNLAGWTTYTADYTRYLPKKTPSLKVFRDIFLAMAVSTAVLGFFGYMTAQAVTEQTPEGVMRTLEGLTGWFSPLVLLIIGFSAIPVNAINDNSASYCLISSGFKFSRPTSAVFGALLGYVVCLVVSHSFLDYFENFLFLFGHWVGPWAALIIVHWFMVGDQSQKTSWGITVGTLIFVSISALSIVLFSATTLYTAPIATMLDGVDIGPLVGTLVTAALYYVVLRLRLIKLTRPARV
jgi:NCS1 family nucleobase:cation symporter-1